MNIYIYLFVALIFSTEASSGEISENYNKRYYLITHKNNTLCLLGAVHASYQKPKLDEEIINCFDDFQALGVEARSENAVEAFQTTMYVPNINKGERPLKFAPEKLRKELELTLKAENVDADTLGNLFNLHPMAAYRLLSFKLLSKSEINQTTYPGLDHISIKFAEYYKTKIFEIEPITKLGEMERKIPFSVSIQKLESLIRLSSSPKRLANAIADTNALLHIGGEGKLSEICPKIQENFKIVHDLPISFLKYDYDHRNESMATVIEKALKENRKSIVVVGIGHFCGPNGIPNILQKKGYSVKEL